ncbi:hypothetical protein RHS01_04071 [Rhizoctonia solani]|uniref:Uncharacterized protein n=1 Tax=Rhizoctonia solani TaxID=456999 RepID=A0A8H7IGD7_9AGAM|nr:hypothetical protein RHS01_04071 [Rhizoctonia solani]
MHGSRTPFHTTALARTTYHAFPQPTVGLGRKPGRRGGSDDKIRNSASIPLELFNAEMTHDRITQPDHDGPNRFWNSTENDEWHMKTVIGSETVFQREWVDSRVLDVSKREEESRAMRRWWIVLKRKMMRCLWGAAGVGVYGKKRKASMSPIDEGMISDDDVQIIEGPDQGGR